MRIRLIVVAQAALIASCTPADTEGREDVRTQRGDTLVVGIRGAGAWGAATQLQRVAAFGEAEGTDDVTLGNIIAIATAPDRIYATDGQRHAVRCSIPSFGLSRCGVAMAAVRPN